MTLGIVNVSPALTAQSPWLVKDSLPGIKKIFSWDKSPIKLNIAGFNQFFFDFSGTTSLIVLNALVNFFLNGALPVPNPSLVSLSAWFLWLMISAAWSYEQCCNITFLSKIDISISIRSSNFLVKKLDYSEFIMISVTLRNEKKCFF